MQNNKKKSAPCTQSDQNFIDSCDYLTNAASTQDCTGLIPSAPTSDEELEAYDALYKYQPPVISSEGKSDGEVPSK